jgi:tripartite-type tricarboxylate transporter receptor subunit TctC
MKRKMVLCLVGILVLSTFLSFDSTGKVFAQTYPNKPIHLIVAFPPGGTTDVVARLVGQKLSEGLGQPVVVDNRPGASGIIGTEMAAKAAADGYTLLMGYITTNAINPSLYGKLPYDPVKDFAPVSWIASAPLLVMVHPSIPVNSVKELIALAKSKPGQLSYASGGNGSPPHLAGELFKTMAGVDMMHVPYKGSAPAMVDVLGGHVPVYFDGIVTTLPQVKAGKLRALGVTSAKRSPSAPEIPTVAESGLPGFEVISWWGMVVQAGAPKEIVSKLNSEIVKIVQMPDVKERLASQGAIPMGSTPEQFAAHIKAETAKWGKVIRECGVKVD